MIKVSFRKMKLPIFLWFCKNYVVILRYILYVKEVHHLCLKNYPALRVKHDIRTELIWNFARS